MKIFIYQKLEAFFTFLIRKTEFLESCRQYFAICPDCGGNRYKDPPCKNI